MSAPAPNNADPLARYSRQTLFPYIGREGQQRLAAGRALVVGCGALGSVIANTLARAGVGRLRIVDRDFLELHNLQRQVLFDEQDVAAGLPKAIAAAAKLRSINSSIEIEPVVADLTHENVLTLVDGADVIVDGTDNFETRFLLNDAALKRRIPWIYGGAIGAEGQMRVILPGETACLRCMMEDAPPPGTTATCDTAGILGPTIGVVASLESMEAIKILAGRRDAVNRALVMIDLWSNTTRQIKLDALREGGGCATCRGEEFLWLSGERGGQPVVLCGRNAVQISPPSGERISLDALAERLSAAGRVTRNSYLLRLHVDSYALTVFADGRAIISGTDDPAAAKTLYSRYIGA